MSHDSLKHYIQGAVAKKLSQVDANPSKSNQHEIGGLSRAGFKRFLGEPLNGESLSFKAKFFYFKDDQAPEYLEDTVTWYDTRANQTNRSAEYRLYYKDNTITQQIAPSNFFLIAKLTNGELLLAFAEDGSTHEAQLRYLFGLNQLSEGFSQATITDENLSYGMQYLLETLGIQLNTPDQDHWLEKILSEFGDKGFPNTQDFANFTRKTSQTRNPIESPDQTLIEWMMHEEMLFRILEKYYVKQKLKEGFGEEGDDVDDFIQYSLGIQNRRKARAGHAFERHLSFIFEKNNLRFEQGSHSKTTENQKKPDFIFPDFNSYHDINFPSNHLRILGAKTSCKDRWRQVLSEAARISNKHLITLEPAISQNQTIEMQSSGLQLVIPKPLQSTYLPSQQTWLISLEEFIEQTQTLQQST
ncbi:MAG: hypothetical protein JXK16_10335 [Thiotrichales bacterium]|nr:hypothetical protein [Thiotrichales bacterium]